jgi:hypothetical protein
MENAVTDNRMAQRPHEGVVMTGRDGVDGPKAFYILIEALPGHEEDVVQMLRDIRACVEDEPATGPGLRCAIRLLSLQSSKLFRTSPAVTRMSRAEVAISFAMSSG